MGQRANIVVVHEGKPSLYYSWGGAPYLASNLLGGLDRMLRYVEDVPPTDELLESGWGEAAAVIDRDARLLLFFVSYTDFHPDFRRRFLPLLSHNWPGWEVRWADQGMVDIALYVGIDPAEVRSESSDPCRRFKADLGKRSEYTICLVTVGRGGDAVDHGFFDDVADVLAWGPDLVDLLRDRAPTDRREDENADCGAFLDPARREMWVWEDNYLDNRTVEWIAELWPGWTVRRHDEGLRRHVELSGRPAPPDRFDDEAVERITKMLIESACPDPLKLLAIYVKDEAGRER